VPQIFLSAAFIAFKNSHLLHLQEIGLDKVCNELLFLRRLIMTAAKAATMEGIALPEITSRTLQSFPAQPGLKLQSCG